MKGSTAAARNQWRERATRLGLIDREGDDAQVEKEREAGIQLGLTGGVPPVATVSDDGSRREPEERWQQRYAEVAVGGWAPRPRTDGDPRSAG